MTLLIVKSQHIYHHRPSWTCLTQIEQLKGAWPGRVPTMLSSTMSPIVSYFVYEKTASRRPYRTPPKLIKEGYRNSNAPENENELAADVNTKDIHPGLGVIWAKALRT